MSFGQHHLHARQRRARGLEPYPSRTTSRRLFDYFMFALGVTQPFALVPQIIAIYVNHSTEGISPTTWLILTACNLLWMIYGIVHRAVPIAIANAMLFVLDIAIVLGVLYY